MRRLLAALMLALTCACAGGGRASAAPASAAPAAGEALLPHHAVYALSLDGLTSSSAVVEAAGRFEFEWRDVCDGWAITQKFRIALLYEDGVSVSFGWSLSSWESRDGSRYRFFIRRFDGSGQTGSVSGEAELREDGSGRAVFNEPEEREVDLPKGTLFPTGHTLHVLSHTEVDGSPIWTTVFDGSGDKGLFGVSTVLSERLGPDAPMRLSSPLVEDVPSWRVNLAFFDTGAESVVPEQEQALRLYANGVVDEMTLDYGDFVLDASLTELTRLPRPEC